MHSLAQRRWQEARKARAAASSGRHNKIADFKRRERHITGVWGSSSAQLAANASLRRQESVINTIATPTLNHLVWSKEPSVFEHTFRDREKASERLWMYGV